MSGYCLMIRLKIPASNRAPRSPFYALAGAEVVALELQLASLIQPTMEWQLAFVQVWFQTMATLSPVLLPRADRTTAWPPRVGIARPTLTMGCFYAEHPVTNDCVLETGSSNITKTAQKVDCIQEKRTPGLTTKEILILATPSLSPALQLTSKPKSDWASSCST